jgi:hypothetical protein
MALGTATLTLEQMPRTIPQMRNHRGLIEDFYNSKQLMVMVTGVDNHFTAATCLREQCKRDRYFMAIHVLTRNGTIYLLSLQYPFKQIPKDIQDFVKFTLAQKRKKAKLAKAHKK